LFNLIICLIFYTMWLIIILYKNKIFVLFWSYNLLKNLNIISLNKPLLLASVCVEVKSAFKVLADSSENVKSLISVF
jgi:hypothetical protein